MHLSAPPVVSRNLLILFVFLLPGIIAAQSVSNPQDTTEYLQVDTKDGYRYAGRIRSINAQQIVLDDDFFPLSEAFSKPSYDLSFKLSSPF
jgi:hypothetical protein